MPIPLVHPEILDAAVQACLEPDHRRLRELVEKLEHYLEVTDDDLADDLTPSCGTPQSPPRHPRLIGWSALR